MKLTKEVIESMYDNLVQLILDYKQAPEEKREEILKRVVYALGLLTTALFMSSEKAYNKEKDKKMTKDLNFKAGRLMDQLEKL